MKRLKYIDHDIVRQTREDIFNRPKTKQDYAVVIDTEIIETIRKVTTNLTGLRTVMLRYPYSPYYYRHLLRGDIEKVCLQRQKKLIQEEMQTDPFTDQINSLLRLEQNAPSYEQLYTKSSLANELNVPITIVDKLLVSENIVSTQKILALFVEREYALLIELTEKLKIPVVTN